MEPKTKTVGVLMLETRFPRLVGDIGNPDGFEFPILYKIVEGASPKKVVDEQDQRLVQRFIDAALELVDEGAELITTSCGFLACFQEELAHAIPVPVITSSLLMLDELELRYGKGNVGILTISSSSMSPSFLNAAGVDPNTPIGSTENGMEFTRSILTNQPTFDRDACTHDLRSAAQSLKASHENIRAILLECTNMPPHSDAIQTATDLPVYSLNTLLRAHAIQH